jgi:hypothetical protein
MTYDHIQLAWRLKGELTASLEPTIRKPDSRGTVIDRANLRAISKREPAPRDEQNRE